MKPEVWFGVKTQLIRYWRTCVIPLVPQKAETGFMNYGVKAKKKTTAVNFIHQLEGGWVPEEEIEQARLDTDSRTFEQEYEAQFYVMLVLYTMPQNKKHKSISVTS